MAEYEMVREIQNMCPNNQMRDVFFEEVETDDPEAYVKAMLSGSSVQVSADRGADGVVTVFSNCDGLLQKFIFTPI